MAFTLNLHTPVAQKVADEVVFRRFQGEGVEFFKSDHTDSSYLTQMSESLFERIRLKRKKRYFLNSLHIIFLLSKTLKSYSLISP